MPMPQHCIESDKVAVVLQDTVPYCPRCYSKEKFGEKQTSAERRKTRDRRR